MPLVSSLLSVVVQKVNSTHTYIYRSSVNACMQNGHDSYSVLQTVCCRQCTESTTFFVGQAVCTSTCTVVLKMCGRVHGVGCVVCGQLCAICVQDAV